MTVSSWASRLLFVSLESDARTSRVLYQAYEAVHGRNIGTLGPWSFGLWTICTQCIPKLITELWLCHILYFQIKPAFATKSDIIYVEGVLSCAKWWWRLLHSHMISLTSNLKKCYGWMWCEALLDIVWFNATKHLLYQLIKTAWYPSCVREWSICCTSLQKLLGTLWLKPWRIERWALVKWRSWHIWMRFWS